MWHYEARGSGPPLVLLHGIGMSHTAWTAVVPLLCTTRRVLAFDIAGFGATPPLPAGTPPTLANLVDGLDASIREIGLDIPLDIAGNSLGGLMALEAARRGLARSAVAISPPALWRTNPPPHVRPVFTSLRFMATRYGGIAKALMRVSLTRELMLAVPLSVGSRRMPARDAMRTVDDLGRSCAFEETFEQTRTPFCGRDITVPVTVVYGERDWILPRRWRCRDRMPAHTRWIEQPGWGHVPMWVDPLGVARTIAHGEHEIGYGGHRGLATESTENAKELATESENTKELATETTGNTKGLATRHHDH